MPPVNPRTAPIVRHTQEPAAKARKRVRIVRGAPEDDLQEAILERWELLKVPDAQCFHVPNGGHRSWSVARKMKRLGTLAGMTDLVFINIFGLAFFMEVKPPSLPGSKRQRGRLSEEQKAFRDWCQSHRVPWVVVRSVQEAEEWLAKHGLIKATARPNS